MTRARSDAFAPLDWALLAAAALMWGSSFLLIEIGLDDLEPAAIAWLRLLFGAATLGCIPAARREIRRDDWPGAALLGVVWMAGPFLLFAYAQQSIASSLAGMINAAAPLFTVAMASLLFGRVPTGGQLTGLLVGLTGVLAISWPAARGADASALGAGLVLLATLSYGVAFNLAEPLEARNGALPVIWRAQLAAVLLVSPAGLVGVIGSRTTGSSIVAMVALGALGTGLAFAAFTTLLGRVGAGRGSVAVYFIPVVAIALGVVFLGEQVAAVAVGGTGLVLVGAYLTGRGERGPPR